MIRRLILSLLATPDHRAALARVAHLEGRVFELETNRAALDTLAASEEARADEAERMLDREQMINKRLGEELARARSTVGASWLVPRGAHDEDAGPESISPATDAAYRAQIASLRRAIRDFCDGTTRDDQRCSRVLTADVNKLRALGEPGKGAASCACSADARRSDADEVLR